MYDKIMTYFGCFLPIIAAGKIRLTGIKHAVNINLI